MADEKLNTGPEGQKTPEAAQPAQVDPVTVPEQAAAPVPQPEQAGPAEPAPGDVVVSFEQINELMAEKRQAARAEIEKAEDIIRPHLMITIHTKYSEAKAINMIFIITVPSVPKYIKSYIPEYYHCISFVSRILSEKSNNRPNRPCVSPVRRSYNLLLN